MQRTNGTRSTGSTVEGHADLPVVGIAHTHFHSDHVGGTEAFLSEKEGDGHGQNNACQTWALSAPIDELVQTMVHRVDSAKAEGQDRQLRINFVETPGGVLS